jgi:acyl-coenzyme A synthetase/AMP-(fatty) acid ligase
VLGDRVALYMPMVPEVVMILYACSQAGPDCGIFSGFGYGARGAVDGATFRPRAIHAVPELPKTQSGKVGRRLIRLAYLREPLGDSSIVENPAALERFKG